MIALEHERRCIGNRFFPRMPLEGILDRMRNSPHVDIRRATFLGLHHGRDPYPVLIADEQWENHFWCLGATRSGKSARFVHPFAVQRIRRNDGPVVIIDMKGDDAMFHGIRATTVAENRRFLHFTNASHLSTYLFNPRAQSTLDQLTIAQYAQVFVNALDLFHGSNYAKGFFSAQSRRGFAEALRMERDSTPGKQRSWLPTEETSQIRSFAQMREWVEKAVKKHPEYGGAHHLLMVLEDLAGILQLNFDDEGRALPQSALDHAIHVPSLFVPGDNGTFPVVYFYLRAGIDMVGIAQIAKLFIYLLFITRMQMMDDFKLGRLGSRPPVVPIFLDEAQLLCQGGESLRLLLAQASGAGLHFVLANQDISQLQTGDTDLLSSVWENCRTKLIFTASEERFVQRLVAMSGEKTIHVPAYQVSHDALRDGMIGPDSALHVLNGQFVPINIQERVVPRFQPNDFIEMSSDPNRFLYVPSQAASIADYGGYPIMVDGHFHISRDEHEYLSNLPWPEPTSETIVPAEFQGTHKSRSK